MTNGKIGVTTENIFPVIKKFLYSDHEIFLRELVSNAVDATQKLNTLATSGVFKGELGDTTIRLSIDENAKTLTVTDRGIGMTAEEIDKYINQIAFSGAEEFLAKYKDQPIIGHFGLGFYSAFMVADKVEIFSQSYQEGAKAVHWSCTGSPEYDMEQIEDRDRGTTIVLHLSEDCKEYAVKSTIENLLTKYCHFLPISIAFGKKQEWKDGKYVDTEEDKIINDTTPIWTRKPIDIKDEEYNTFYQKLYPASEEPLFHIHLNIDYPFNLTGVLYFPRIHNNFEIQKNKIQLYCNQVFVTDQVEGIVPDYLTLLHGVIDSPDIPLNVSRSYLQSDANVKKISSYITRKVADRLTELFNNARTEYESKWDDLKIFIQYGILTDEKFAEKASSFMLWKNTEGKYFTAEEYKTAVKDNQTDKNKNLIILYVDNAVEKMPFVANAKSKGYDVLEAGGQLDSHYINWYESKNENIRFVRVDSDTIENLIQKEEEIKCDLTDTDKNILRPMFEGSLPKEEKVNYNVAFAPMSAEDAPAIITQDEFMRRMKDMSKMSGGQMSQFYAQMPDSYNIVVNANHPLVKSILEKANADFNSEIVELNSAVEKAVTEEKNFEKVTSSKKEDDFTTEEKQMREDLSKAVVNSRDKFNSRLAEIGKKNNKISQIIDLALLSNGLLKGNALAEFIKRSVAIIK